MRWFRVYNDVVSDPKVQRLSGDKFKSWINLLCVASQHDGILASNSINDFPGWEIIFPLPGALPRSIFAPWTLSSAAKYLPG